MSVFRLARFKIGPADTEAMLERRAALVAVIRSGFPGLIEAQLAKIDDETWIDVWRWDTWSSAQSATSRAPSIPEAGAAFSLTKGITLEYAEVVDET